MQDDQCNNTKNISGMPPIEVPLDNNTTNTTEGTLCQSRICGHKVQGTDCGTDISEWLSLAIGLPNLRLIKQSNCHDKKKGIFGVAKFRRFLFIV